MRFWGAVVVSCGRRQIQMLVGTGRADDIAGGQAGALSEVYNLCRNRGLNNISSHAFERLVQGLKKVRTI